MVTTYKWSFDLEEFFNAWTQGLVQIEKLRFEIEDLKIELGKEDTDTS